jgi:hypothetical protein
MREGERGTAQRRRKRRRRRSRDRRLLEDGLRKGKRWRNFGGQLGSCPR